MTIKAVFFDVGQTLLHPVPDGAGFSSVAELMGYSFSSEDILSNNTQMYARYNEHYNNNPSFWNNHESAKAVWVDAYTVLYDLLGTGKDAEQLASMAQQFYFSPGAWFPYADVEVELSKLAQTKVKLGLISNWDSSLVPVIKDLELDRYFDAMISSADVGMHKPDANIFFYALEQLDAKPEEAIHVGDHLTADVQGAMNAGLHAVYIDRYESHPEYSLAPRITSLEELQAIIDGLNSL